MRFPNLKSFLKDGEAESYQGVSVKYVPGKKAIMTIYKDEKAQESVSLHEIDNKEMLHSLFRQKGFVQKSGEAPTSRIGKSKKSEDLSTQHNEDNVNNGEDQLKMNYFRANVKLHPPRKPLDNDSLQKNLPNTLDHSNDEKLNVEHLPVPLAGNASASSFVLLQDPILMDQLETPSATLFGTGFSVLVLIGLVFLRKRKRRIHSSRNRKY